VLTLILILKKFAQINRQVTSSAIWEHNYTVLPDTQQRGYAFTPSQLKLFCDPGGCKAELTSWLSGAPAWLHTQVVYNRPQTGSTLSNFLHAMNDAKPSTSEVKSSQVYWIHACS